LPNFAVEAGAHETLTRRESAIEQLQRVILAGATTLEAPSLCTLEVEKTSVKRDDTA
jgi:hypothetical protein